MIGGKVKWNPKGGEIPNIQIIVSVELEHGVCFPSSLTIYRHFCEAEASIPVLQGSEIWETKQLEHVTVGQLDKVSQLYETLESVLTNLKATHGNTTQMLNKNNLMRASLLVFQEIYMKNTLQSTIIFWDWPKKPRDMSFGCLNDPSPGFQTGLFPRCPHLLWQVLISTSLAASSLALPISLLICGVFAMALKHWPYPMLGLFTYRHNLRKSSSVNWAITWNSDVGKQCSVMLANLYPNRNHIFDGWTWCTKNDN